jgi:hypothetical protein
LLILVTVPALPSSLALFGEHLPASSHPEGEVSIVGYFGTFVIQPSTAIAERWRWPVALFRWFR